MKIALCAGLLAVRPNCEKWDSAWRGQLSRHGLADVPASLRQKNDALLRALVVSKFATSYRFRTTFLTWS